MSESAKANLDTGAAWPSSARLVRCWVMSRNEPHPWHRVLRKRTPMRRPVTHRQKVGMSCGPHGPSGYAITRHTRVGTWGCQASRWVQAQKADRSPDRSLQLDSVKSVSLVIVAQIATVNSFSGLVYTACHTMGLRFT